VAGIAVYELPLLKNRKGVLAHALGGWQVSALVSARTGVPLRITQPSGIANPSSSRKSRFRHFDGSEAK
jgi:hypothetical protein